MTASVVSANIPGAFGWNAAPPPLPGKGDGSVYAAGGYAMRPFYNAAQRIWHFQAWNNQINGIMRVDDTLTLRRSVVGMGAVGIATDGRVIAAAGTLDITNGSPNSPAIALVDPTTLAPVWSKTYGLAGQLVGCTPVADGSLVFAVRGHTGFVNDTVLLHLALDGSILHAVRIPATQFSVQNIQFVNGRLLCLGRSELVSTSGSYALLELDDQFAVKALAVYGEGTLPLGQTQTLHYAVSDGGDGFYLAGVLWLGQSAASGLPQDARITLTHMDSNLEATQFGQLPTPLTHKDDQFTLNGLGLTNGKLLVGCEHNRTSAFANSWVAEVDPATFNQTRKQLNYTSELFLDGRLLTVSKNYTLYGAGNKVFLYGNTLPGSTAAAQTATAKNYLTGDLTAQVTPLALTLNAGDTTLQLTYNTLSLNLQS